MTSGSTGSRSRARTLPSSRDTPGCRISTGKVDWYQVIRRHGFGCVTFACYRKYRVLTEEKESSEKFLFLLRGNPLPVEYPPNITKFRWTSQMYSSTHCIPWLLLPLPVGNSTFDSFTYLIISFLFFRAPWNRFQPYLIGLLLGYILHLTRDKAGGGRRTYNFIMRAIFLHFHQRLAQCTKSKANRPKKQICFSCEGPPELCKLFLKKYFLCIVHYLNSSLPT